MPEMAKKNVERQKRIKKLLMDNKEDIPYEKILLSATNVRRGQAVINSITGRYGNEKVYYRPVPQDNDVAKTDGRKIIVNVGCDFIADEPTLQDKKIVEQGLYSHECGHILFTDFGFLKNTFEAWQNAKNITFDCQNYPYYDKRIFNEINDVFAKYPEIIFSVLFNIVNIYEDAYIEDKIKKIYKGSVTSSINKIKELLQKYLMNRLDELDWSGYLLMQVRGCLPKSIVKKYPVFEKTEKLNRANLNGFCSFKDRLGRSISTVFLLWDEHIKEQVQEAIEEQKMKELVQQLVGDELDKLMNQKQQNGMASNSVAPPNGSSGSGESNPSNGNNSKSGKGNKSSKSSRKQQNSGSSGDGGEKSDENEKSENEASGSSGEGDDKSDETSDGTSKNTNNTDSDDSDGDSDGDNTSGDTGDMSNSSKKNVGFSGNGEEYEQRSLFDDFSQDNQKSTQQQNTPHIVDNGEAKETNEVGTVENVSEDEYFNKIKNCDDNIADENKTDVGDVASNMSELLSQSINELMSSNEESIQRIADKLETTEITNTDFHRGINTTIYHITNGSHSRYSAIVEKEKISMLSKTMQKKIKKDLFERRKGSTKHNLYSGKNLDLKSVCNGSDKVFKQNKLPNNKPLISASVLIDQSGSMCGEKIKKATVAAILLEDFCRNMNIPFSITGHSTKGGSVAIYDFIDFGERNKSARERLANITTNECNRDGFAIRYVANKLAKRNEETKLLFFISDGLPNHHGYGSVQLTRDLKDMKRMFKSKNIVFVPLCIDKDCYPELKAIYGASLVDATDLKKFPVLLNSILVKEIKKKFN